MPLSSIFKKEELGLEEKIQRAKKKHRDELRRWYEKERDRIPKRLVRAYRQGEMSVVLELHTESRRRTVHDGERVRAWVHRDNKLHKIECVKFKSVRGLSGNVTGIKFWAEFED